MWPYLLFLLEMNINEELRTINVEELTNEGRGIVMGPSDGWSHHTFIMDAQLWSHHHWQAKESSHKGKHLLNAITIMRGKSKISIECMNEKNTRQFIEDGMTIQPTRDPRQDFLSSPMV